MTQIVRMHIREIMLLQQLFEFCIHIGGIHVLSVFPSENRTPVNPTAADIQFSLLLPFHLLGKCLHNLRRQGNDSRTTLRFRSAELVLHLAAVCPELSLDTVEVSGYSVLGYDTVFRNRPGGVQAKILCLAHPFPQTASFLGAGRKNR